MAREAAGPHVGTYDAFGGAKDGNENHPVATAARELAEETIGLLGSPSQLRHHLDVHNHHTCSVVANYQKQFVVYFTHFNLTQIQNLVHNFYSARQAATHYKYKEKDRLAWVKWSNLKNAIAQAQRDNKDVYCLFIFELMLYSQMVHAALNRSPYVRFWLVV